MIDIFLNLVLKMRLKDKVKRISTQSKDIEKRFNSLLIVLSKEEGFKTRHLPELADRLGIASKNITLVVLCKKENNEMHSNFENTHVISKKALRFLGKLPDSTKELFGKTYDIQLNFFNRRSAFLEFISASFHSKLRVGFCHSNQEINDLILAIDPNDEEVLLKETTTYLNAILKK